MQSLAQKLSASQQLSSVILRALVEIADDGFKTFPIAQSDTEARAILDAKDRPAS